MIGLFAGYWASNLDHIADHEVWGTFGDFFGGVYGTIFTLISVILMYVTFKSQRELTRNSDRIQQDIARAANEAQEKLSERANDFQRELTHTSNEQAERQRFNDLFFELLKLYKSSIAELGLGYIEEGECLPCGCGFLDAEMDKMMCSFNPSDTYGTSVRMGAYRYIKFYLENASILAPVFRTLYRLMELIDKAEIKDDDKLLYGKIVRAQLRESELFFLRYNCMTQYGDNFIEYVNKYRLLKHLPVMSLLEFKKFRVLLENNQGIYLTLNLIARTIWRTLRKVTIGEIRRSSIIQIGEISQRYSLSADMSSLNTTVLNLRINPHKRYTKPDLKPLSRLEYKDLAKLLENLLSEIYRYSNFRRYNKEEPAFSLRSDFNASTPGLVHIWASLSMSEPLRLTHPAWDERYGIINKS